MRCRIYIKCLILIGCEYKYESFTLNGPHFTIYTKIIRICYNIYTTCDSTYGKYTIDYYSAQREGKLF